MREREMVIFYSFYESLGYKIMRQVVEFGRLSKFHSNDVLFCSSTSQPLLESNRVPLFFYCYQNRVGAKILQKLRFAKLSFSQLSKFYLLLLPVLEVGVMLLSFANLINV
jgi:hypothetical protein